MASDDPTRTRRGLLAVGCGILLLGLLTAVSAVSVLQRTSPPKPEGGGPGTTVPRASLPQPAARRSVQKQMPRPVHISIPAIGVSAPIVPLGLNTDGTLQVPTNFADAGWFTKGPEPGERGAAVIVGHLESLTGSGVFYHLDHLQAGRVVRIQLRDGSTVRYVVDSMLRVSKDHFPTKRVYVSTGKPALRLITCAGAMNATTGHHPDNYIVFASLIA
jgi:LPXTG-site transpeptidase (sortase) family protein